MSARFTLRSATAEAHEALDALFSRFDLTHRDGYGDFLLAQAGAFIGVEAALDQAGAARVLADWRERQRRGALSRDLADLGLEPPPPIAPPDFPTEAAVLGGLYVLEGSRLGGAMLVRNVPDDLPKAFLSPGNPMAWRAFVAVVDQRLSSAESLERAADAARSVFDVFAASARRLLGTDHA